MTTIEISCIDCGDKFIRMGNSIRCHSCRDRVSKERFLIAQKRRREKKKL